MLPGISIPKPYPALLWMSFLALGLLGCRIVYLTPISNKPWLDQLQEGNFHFLFLAWNLLLAWIPLFISHFLVKKQRSIWMMGLITVCWLLLFPNAPYLITDFVHLRVRTSIPFGYDIILLFTFATLGLSLGMCSLEQMRKYLRFYWGYLAARLFVAITLFASGFGIYLGRVLRWNSWDAILHPWGPVQDTLNLMINPQVNWEAWFLIIGFSLSLSACYWVMSSWNTQ